MPSRSVPRVLAVLAVVLMLAVVPATAVIAQDATPDETIATARSVAQSGPGASKAAT